MTSGKSLESLRIPGGGGFHHIPTDPRPQNPMESHQTTNGEAEGRREEEERRGRGEGKEVAN